MPLNMFLSVRQYLIFLRCNLIPFWTSRVVLESEPRAAEGTLVPLNVIQSWFILEPHIFKCVGVSSQFLLIYVHLHFYICGNLEIPYSSLDRPKRQISFQIIN